MIVKGVKLIDADDFTDTYDNLDSDLEEFNGSEDFEDDFIDDEVLELIENMDADLEEDEL